jgi:hypothetical protein
MAALLTNVISLLINVKIFSVVFILRLVPLSYFVKLEEHSRIKKIVKIVERN